MRSQDEPTQQEKTEETLEAFRRYLEEQNLSAHTITAYCGGVRLYLRMFDTITADSLAQYRQELIRRYKAATVNQRIIAINRYIRFLSETEADPFPETEPVSLVTVKIQQKSFLDSIISNEDYETLKRELKACGNWFWYFAVRFLGSTGARVSELVQIKAEHLALGYLDLYSKGGKMRRIYIPDSLCSEALAWCESRGQTSGFLFVNKEGKPVSSRGVHAQLKQLALRYGIDPDTVYPHSFRHRFAKNFLQKCNDISLLADLMGHESIETTRIYLTRSSREIQEFLDEIVTW